MNWLAHALLSESDPESRLGNLLADWVKGPDRAAMSPNFLRGVRRHQAIDAFTESHPAVHRSRGRIGDGYRHTRGIIVDVFYDHFLALNWERYCPEPLEAFTAGVHSDLLAHRASLPGGFQSAVDRMVREDWLASYRQVAGVQAALARVSRQLSVRQGKAFELETAVSVLRERFDGFDGDFAEFFPSLQAQVGRIPAVLTGPVRHPTGLE